MTIDLNLIRENFNGYVVSPLNAFGLGGFVFDIEGDIQANLQTEITDHYIETNQAIQDHIAIKPLEITLKNYVGELVYRKDSETNTIPQQLTRKLTTVSSYLPVLTDAAVQAKELLSQDLSTTLNEFSLSDIPSITNDVVDLWSLTKNLNPAASSQQQAYLYFKALLQQKILVSVQTPFEFATNMAVKSIMATQPEESSSISDFAITLKQIRTVSTDTVPFDADSYQGRAKVQKQETSNKGKTQGAATNSSTLFDLVQGAYNAIN